MDGGKSDAPESEAFRRADGRLICGEVDVEVLARRHGTPLYVYCAETLRARYRAFRDAFGGADATVCYSVKSNSNLSVLRVLAEVGASFDVVSGGELFRVLRAGVDPSRVVFTGVGKTEAELRDALAAGVALLNVESPSEVDLIDRLARERDRVVEVLLRLNPDVDPGTHRHVSTGRAASKFGMPAADIERLIDARARFANVRIRGFHVHIGSQVESVEPYLAALSRVATLVEYARRRGVEVAIIDVGGGYGVSYRDLTPSIERYGAAIADRVRQLGCSLHVEPGRYIAGPAGALVTEVQYVKRAPGGRRFVVVDAGMNDLLRPALYEAWHRVEPVLGELDTMRRFACDVVGPVCESADSLARDRDLPAVARGDLLLVFDAGAYGWSMASNYNSRPRPAELLVDGSRVHLARRRETLEDLVRGEEEGS